MGMFRTSDGSDDQQERLAQLERRIQLLERAVRTYGIPVPSPYEGEPTEASVSPAVRQLVEDGKKLEAIKMLVSDTGMGLKEAKDIVDRL